MEEGWKVLWEKINGLEMTCDARDKIYDELLLGNTCKGPAGQSALSLENP